MYSQSESTVRLIDSIKSDILCLQETSKQWELFLNNHLKTNYPHRRFYHFPERSGGGIALLSKYPIATDILLKNTVGWFPALYGIIETPLGKISILNVHLKPGVNERGRIGFLGREYFKAQTIHKEELTLFIQTFTMKIADIIVGDFNETPRGKGVAFMQQLGYSQTLAQSYPKKYTWQWRIFKQQYDYIFYREEFVCQNSSVYYKGESDHFPVVGVLKRKYRVNEK